MRPLFQRTRSATFYIYLSPFVALLPVQFESHHFYLIWYLFAAWGVMNAMICLLRVIFGQENIVSNIVPDGAGQVRHETPPWFESGPAGTLTGPVIWRSPVLRGSARRALMGGSVYHNLPASRIPVEGIQ